MTKHDPREFFRYVNENRDDLRYGSGDRRYRTPKEEQIDELERLIGEELSLDARKHLHKFTHAVLREMREKFARSLQLAHQEGVTGNRREDVHHHDSGPVGENSGQDD